MNKPRVRLGHRSPFPFPFSLSGKSLAEHKHVMGKTRSGKSKLLAHMAASMIQQGMGVTVIDPASDLGTDILGLLYCRGYFTGPDAMKKLLYIDFADPARFLPFNVLSQPYDPTTVAGMLVEVCTRVWPSLGDGQAPLFETIMRASLPVLIANKLPLPYLHTLLTNRTFREHALTRIADEKIRFFFHYEFDHWGRDQMKFIGSSTRRSFLLSYMPALRYSLGQHTNALPIGAILDQNISLICNLGGLDEETQTMLGCMLTMLFEQEALYRAQREIHLRTHYQLIIDECFQFCSRSEKGLERMLALSAKFGLTLTLCHQNWSQFSQNMQGAIQNTMSIFFKMGGLEDARWAAPIVGTFDPYQVKEVATKTDKDLSTTTYFSEQYEVWARSLMELQPREAYIKTGRAKYGVKIKTVKVPDMRPYLPAITEMKERYATQLLTPLAQVQAYEQHIPAGSSAVSRKKLIKT
jgi:hypothetical protein